VQLLASKLDGEGSGPVIGKRAVSAGGVKELGEARWRLARRREEALEGTIAKE